MCRAEIHYEIARAKPGALRSDSPPPTAHPTAFRSSSVLAASFRGLSSGGGGGGASAMPTLAHQARGIRVRCTKCECSMYSGGAALHADRMPRERAKAPRPQGEVRVRALLCALYVALIAHAPLQQCDELAGACCCRLQEEEVHVRRSVTPTSQTFSRPATSPLGTPNPT